MTGCSRVDLSQFPSGLTHYWPILNGAMTDCVGTKNLVATSSAYTTDRNSLTNDAINFNNGFATAPSDTYFSSAFTITLWTKVAACSTQWCNLVNFAQSAGIYDIILALSGTNADQISFYMYSNGGTVKAFIDTTVNLSTTLWNFVAVTYDGYTIQIYVNGGLVASTSNIVYWIPESQSRTGRIGGKYLSTVNGKTVGNSLSQVDQIAIYNRDLTLTQISNLNNYYTTYTPTGVN